MRNIKLTIEYDGTKYSGWQIQPGCNTIQGEITTCLKKILNTEVKLIGSGRTDSGVHALGQVANFKTPSTKTCNEIMRAANALLPLDISIISAVEVRPDFHAQYSAKWKTYRYRICTRQAKPALNRHFCYHHPYSLNLHQIRKQAKTLIGRKNFKSFQAVDSSKKREDTIRTIRKLTIRKMGDLIDIEIEANGFLYKMVRNIVGTLLEIGSGTPKHVTMQEIIDSKDRKFAGVTAKAQGLSLLEVKY